jgi:VanZ family protein
MRGHFIMIKKEHLSFRSLPIAFFIILAAMIFAGLYPFNFFQPNRVQWLSNEPGLYFDGVGIAFTEKAASISLKKAASIELLLKERRDSKNWGPREIFSFYDGAVSPSLLVGQWNGRIFIYSRFENNESDKWYRIFRIQGRFPREKDHLVTVTFDAFEKAIYIDGRLENKQNVVLKSKSDIAFSGRFMLGNSPILKNGWYGEIKGLAIYNRILSPEEIAMHSRAVFKKGMHALAETPGCLALYPFDEGKGKTAGSILGDIRPFSIPESLNARGYFLKLIVPHNNMRSEGFNTSDIIRNIIFFVPFGALLSAVILRKYTIGYAASFLIVILAGGLLSFMIESLQLFLPSRVPGISDILSNMVGSALGMLFSFFMLRRN